ncbi:MAG: glutamine--fructose-6-phosphate transaminase (isomerizing) [Candidatus Altiarchaeales archaeon]|nr:glutamine--fructose-6-phosphate transaminase (isomerizing) [Candidatus Altiarchaeales archaeon]
MCGIAGYIGERNSPEVLFDMLERLEYRGYDSAGVMFIAGRKINIIKDKGKVSEVRSRVKPERYKSDIGVAHTRWATHGVPSKVNAHPHADCKNLFAVSHNGIIENYVSLRRELTLKGHKFQSDTDTEVISHLMEENYKGDLLTAFRESLDVLEGSYALAVLCVKEPNRILIARKESPLIVGLGKQENFIASDAPAFMPYTKEIIILNDFEYGFVEKDRVEVFDLVSGKKLKKQKSKITWDVKEAEKAGYHHFMLKEIMEEPDAVSNALKASGELKKIASRLKGKKRVYFVACGTAYHAGLTGKYLLENFGIQSEAVVASEFRYSTVDTVDKDCGIVLISQSGETADTIAAGKRAREKGAYVAGIVNVVGSTIARLVEDVAYTYSGPEIAVASTKAYIGQLVSLTQLALYLSLSSRKISVKEFERLQKELKGVSGKIKAVLSDGKIREIAEECAVKKTFFYIGRTLNYPTALEGALKLKEISYLHAEGYPAGELKHGPLAILEEDVVVIAIKTGRHLEDKMDSNIQETKARNARTLIVAEDGEIKVPRVDVLLTPLVNIVPLHLFAYYISVLKGLDPDKPRNLAKSVTVE